MSHHHSAVRFDPEKHEYWVDGQRVPGVTEILGAVGVTTDFEDLAGISRKHAGDIDARRTLGSVVHTDCHSFDDADIVLSAVDPRVMPYLQAWATFRKNHDWLVPAARERVVYHAVLRYAGTPDGVFVCAEGHNKYRVLIDIKIGDPEDAACRFQTAAYKLAYEHQTGELITDRWGVQLTPDKDPPYRVHPYLDWRDCRVWEAFKTTFDHQKRKRRR